MYQRDVIVVGAGLSGIHAAALLTARGHDCLLLEAAGNAGGRVHSTSFNYQGSEFVFDLGASWFWPQSQHRMKALVDSLGLETFPQFSDGSVWVERFRLEQAERYIPDSPNPSRAVRLVGGMKALVDACLTSLPAGCLQLGHAVTRIERGVDGTFFLTPERGITLSCNRIILAIPPRQLLNGLSFSPALSPDIKNSLRRTPTWIAGQAKAIFIYPSPFWRTRGHSGLVSSVVGPLQEIHDASPSFGVGALFGFFGLSASQRSSLSELELKFQALQQLARLFGSEATTPIGFFYLDWVHRPYIAATADMALPNGYTKPIDTAPLEATYDGRLVFAGSEFASEHNGYLEGALASAESAVARVMS